MAAARGFTLIEMLVVVALFAALLAIGVPAFMGMLANNRIAEATNRLTASLHYARGEALRRNRCVRVAAASGGWTEGWSVEADQSTTCAGTSYTTLRVEESLGGALTLTESSGATSLIYSSDGTLASPPAGIALDLCDAARNGETGRRVSINASGRPAVSDITCS